MKKTIFQSDKGTPSMMRYLSHRGFWFGVYTTAVFSAMIMIAYFMDRIEWAPHFMALAMAGIGLSSASIAGKGIQKKYEIGGINE